jgi:hypothetical protein
MARQGQPLRSRWGGLSNDNGGGIALLPVGIGLALGGLLYLALTQSHTGAGMAPAGMAAFLDNPGRRKKVKVKSYMRKIPGKRKRQRVRAYSYSR